MIPEPDPFTPLRAFLRATGEQLKPLVPALRQRLEALRPHLPPEDDFTRLCEAEDPPFPVNLYCELEILVGEKVCSLIADLDRLARLSPEDPAPARVAPYHLWAILDPNAPAEVRRWKEPA